jgi:quercetin dioxygenase-like cupin family protein
MNINKFLRQLLNAPNKDDKGNEIKSTFFESDGLFSVEMRIPAGLIVGKHSHSYSHLSFLSKGKVELDVDGNKSIVEAPACVNIVAGKAHAISAITDVVWYCTHATDERIIDQ